MIIYIIKKVLVINYNLSVIRGFRSDMKIVVVVIIVSEQEGNVFL
jgi:hypothetical protein